MKKSDPQPSETTAQARAWAVMLKNINERVAAGQKKVEIAKLLGVGRSKITEWLDPAGRLTGERTPVDKMRHYFSQLGLDPAPYFGSTLEDMAKRIEELEQENAKLKDDLIAAQEKAIAAKDEAAAAKDEVLKLYRGREVAQPRSQTDAGNTENDVPISPSAVRSS